MSRFTIPLSTRLGLCALALLAPSPISAQADHDPSRWLTLWAGMLPVIIAAPHGGRTPLPGIPPRRGIGVAQFTSERDSNTAELAELVAGKLSEELKARPFLVVAHFERKFIDVNRAEAEAFESPEARSYYEAYHRALRDAAARVKEVWGGGLLLDIHGQGAESDTIFRGTHNGRSVAALRRRFGAAALAGPKSILGQLAALGYRVAPADDHETRYTGGYTTQTYGSHRGTAIDAIQLELGANLRRQANLERTASDLARAIEIFAREYLPLDQSSGAGRPKAVP